METKGSQESLQSRLSFFHHGRLFSSDRDDSSDSDDYLETGLKQILSILRLKACTRLPLNQIHKKIISYDFTFYYLYDDIYFSMIIT